MIEGVEEVRISHDSTEDTLVITEQDKRHLTSNCDHGPELKALPIPVEIRRPDHDGRWGARQAAASMRMSLKGGDQEPKRVKSKMMDPLAAI